MFSFFPRKGIESCYCLLIFFSNKEFLNLFTSSIDFTLKSLFFNIFFGSNLSTVKWFQLELILTSMQSFNYRCFHPVANLFIQNSGTFT